MTLEEYCNSISEASRLELAIELCEKALPIWNEFAQDKKRLEYQDSVVGLYHKVRPELLNDSINFCKNPYTGKFLGFFTSKPSLKSLLNEFSEPVVAMQDFDWELPHKVESTFYAVYNLLKGLKEKTTFDRNNHYISISQAVEALQEGEVLDENEIRKIIYKENYNT
jgi:hypothetical protein